MRRGAKHIYFFFALIFLLIHLMFVNIEINNLTENFVPFSERPSPFIFDDKGNYVPNPEHEPFEQMSLYPLDDSPWLIRAWYAIGSAPWTLLPLFVAVIMGIIWLKQLSKYTLRGL